MSTSAPTQPTFEDFMKTIGCSADTFKALTDTGVNDITDLHSFGETDVTTLCKLIRKDNKSFPFIADRNLQLVVHEAQIRRQTNRSASKMYNAKTADILSWKTRHQEKLSFKDPKDKAPDANLIAKNWATGFEQLEHWIGLHVDEATGMPLIFAVRVAELDDSPFLSSNYSSLFEQYAKRCRKKDRASNDFEWTATIRIKVWNILYGIFHDHPAYQYLRPFKKSRDVPAAYFSLSQHFLGANSVSNGYHVGSRIDTLSYSSETRRWNFEKYVMTHVELYNTAQDLACYGCSGIDNASRVRKLLNGIKTDQRDSVKNQVMSDQALATDFVRVVNLFNGFLAQKRALSKNKRQVGKTGNEEKRKITIETNDDVPPISLPST
jgi:hypothetical protein